MIPKVKTKPDISIESEVHKEVREFNVDYRTSWLYNVEDRFKDKSREYIRETLAKEAFPFSILCEQWVNDFNIASVMRNANAFNAKEIFYIGNKKIDRRGMTGTYNYKDIKWLSSMDEVISLKKDYKFVAIDNLDGAMPLQEYKWEKNTLMVFGSEGVGITDYMRSLCDDTVYIKQYGSVRSLNAAVASGIVMNDFITRCYV